MELTTKQFAAKIGVSHQRVRQLIEEGRIKARLVTTRLLLIDERELKKPSVRNRKPGRPWPKKNRKSK